MSRVEQLEKQIAELSPVELKVLREWFERYEAETWDRQIELDVRSGRLKELTNQALLDREAGHSRDL